MNLAFGNDHIIVIWSYSVTVIINHMPNRRTIMTGLAASAMTLGFNVPSRAAAQPSLTFKTGKQAPKIGMGTWLTFNINPKSSALAQRRQVLTEFYKAGGS